MADLPERIAELEAEIDGMFNAAETCEQIMKVAKMAVAVGALLLVMIVAGVLRLGPVPFVVAIAAVVGGIALFGSNKRTRDDIMAGIRAREAQRAEMIDELAL